ncbi:ParB domain-containing protein [Rubrivivax sp. A210]|uniref:ParB N-terminal domain-containing protein n=1 Tax=Rubrivivax sp. A210 TaxID=2772301 RepID=UPI00191A4A03|nr:ParB N-terminal domain-containing protein [Rubrivivax sp. A210]CAD5366594.1 ParB domain-containing protein [Rubrivivax sp. A210]
MADLAEGRALAFLDPAAVAFPSWLRFRAPQSFSDAGYARLKASIVHMGGNVQPIKACPVDAGRYELVFGTLRLRTCLELGLPVTASLDVVTGPRLVVELDASNGDKQVSAFERGCLYDSALQAGVFPSRRRLAESVGRPLRDVSDAILIATLPPPVLTCLRDPRALKVGMATKVAARWEADPDGAKRRIAALSTQDFRRDSQLLAAFLESDH